LEFIHSRRLSFLSSTIAGDRWSMLPSAAGFVDHCFRQVPVDPAGSCRLAEIIERNWQTDEFQPRLESMRYAHEMICCCIAVGGRSIREHERFEMFQFAFKTLISRGGLFRGLSDYKADLAGRSDA